MLVLDSSIYASIIVKDEFYEACKELVRQRSATLDLAFAESANVIWKHIYLLKRIPSKEVDMRAEMLVKLIKYSKIYLSSDFLPEAAAIAVKCGITVYDSLFITLAKTLDVKFATTDEKLRKRLGKTKLRNFFF
ncbi:MAG: type II toxin-antitoxin system VapC family toxin [Proteobacteria bacterium]|nr:type II toxin-antitoxin system VapC family toxin [Pseudomonadota bacterium]